MCPANVIRGYNVTSSRIGWAHAQNDPCFDTWKHFTFVNLCLVKVRSDNGLVLSANKPSFELLLIKWLSQSNICQSNSLWPSDTIWRQRSRSTLSLVARWHQAIAWSNMDLSLLMYDGNTMRGISQEIHQPSITKSRLKMTHLREISFKSPRGQWVKK